jgi:hypothetical protein
LEAEEFTDKVLFEYRQFTSAAKAGLTADDFRRAWKARPFKSTTQSDFFSKL